jgi:hypothetical protein
VHLQTFLLTWYTTMKKLRPLISQFPEQLFPGRVGRLADRDGFADVAHLEADELLFY